MCNSSADICSFFFHLHVYYIQSKFIISRINYFSPLKGIPIHGDKKNIRKIRLGTRVLNYFIKTPSNIDHLSYIYISILLYPKLYLTWLPSPKYGVVSTLSAKVTTGGGKGAYVNTCGGAGASKGRVTLIFSRRRGGSGWKWAVIGEGHIKTILSEF